MKYSNMPTKNVTTRKERVCEECGDNIPKGTRVEKREFRHARYDDKDRQVGISFYRGYFHSGKDIKNCFSGRDPNKEYHECPECKRMSLYQSRYTARPGGGVQGRNECAWCGYEESFSA